MRYKDIFSIFVLQFLNYLAKIIQIDFDLEPFRLVASTMSWQFFLFLFFILKKL